MPKPTYHTLRLPGSDYKECVTASSCTDRKYDYYTGVGRTWSGSQSRPRNKKFMIPTSCHSQVHEPNTGTIHQGACKCHTKPAFAASGWEGPGSGSWGDDKLDSENVRRIQARALSNFLNNTGLGVTALELGKSGRMISDRLIGVTRILSALRRGDFRKAASVLHEHTGYNTSHVDARARANPNRTFADRASSFWLETTFGWVPLLQSVYDSLQELDRDSSTRRRARSSSGYTKSGVVAEFSTASANRFSKLGLMNPAEIAWDLVPFSFVIDWFIPVGDIIRYLGTKNLTKQMWQWTARKHGRVTTMSGYLGAPEGTLIKRMSYYHRTVSKTEVSTLFHFRLPSSWWHAVTAASLIQSLRPR